MSIIKPKIIDEYIISAPGKVQKKLLELRSILNKAAPEATEAIK